MTDKPKAVHFDAYIHGKKMAANDPVGLEYRWHVARRLEQEGITDMLHMTTEDRMAMQSIINQCNTSWSRSGMKVLKN